MPKSIEYPRILKRPPRLEFKEAVPFGDVVKVYADGKDHRGLVLFENHFAMSWSDWDLMVMWVEKRRRGEA